MSASIIPFADGFSLNNFNTLFFNYSFFAWIKNTLIVSVGVVLLTTICCTLGAYVFSRFKFPMKKGMMFMSKQKIESIFNDEGIVFANISNSKRYSFFVFNENKLSKSYTKYNKQNLYDEVTRLMNNQKFDLDKLIPVEKLSPIVNDPPLNAF
jgi:hypothetical protein